MDKKEPDYIEEWSTYNLINRENKKYTINFIFSLLIISSYLGTFVIMLLLGVMVGFSLGEEKNLATPQSKGIQVEQMYEHIDVEKEMCIEKEDK